MATGLQVSVCACTSDRERSTRMNTSNP